MADNTEKKERILKTALEYLKDNKESSIDIFSDMTIEYLNNSSDLNFPAAHKMSIEMTLKSIKDVILNA